MLWLGLGKSRGFNGPPRILPVHTYASRLERRPPFAPRLSRPILRRSRRAWMGRTSSRPGVPRPPHPMWPRFHPLQLRFAHTVPVVSWEHPHGAGFDCAQPSLRSGGDDSWWRWPRLPSPAHPSSRALSGGRASRLGGAAPPCGLLGISPPLRCGPSAGGPPPRGEGEGGEVDRRLAWIRCPRRLDRELPGLLQRPSAPRCLPVWSMSGRLLRYPPPR